MKKYIVLLMVLLALIFAFVGCSKDNNEPETPETTSDIWGDDDWWQQEPATDDSNNMQDNQNQQTELPTVDNNNNGNNGNSNNQQSTPVIPDYNNNQNNNQNQNNNNNSGSSVPSNPFISDEEMSKLEQSNAEVYFSDNPNNKYIVQVVNKYGVDSSNLIALVKVNATFPSAMVLEFSGKRDANGELIMKYSELKYVYNIDETKNTLVKASKNGTGNDGVSFVEGKILFVLMENYFCPELPNLKANKRYD
ncbi:MAG: hypothetical protein IJA80_07170 [Clostridia bacterium]|nr:hypothetical protein [Clostridia bacterium]